jgi:hypothetical protein
MPIVNQADVEGVSIRYGVISGNTIEYLRELIDEGVDKSYWNLLQERKREVKNWIELLGEKIQILENDPILANEEITLTEKEKLQSRLDWYKNTLEEGVGASLTDEELDGFESSDYLLGDWKERGEEWHIKENGAAGWSGIYFGDSNVVMVFNSKWIRNCQETSPCYPNAGNLDTIGPYLTFDIPPKEYREFSIEDILGKGKTKEDLEKEYIDLDQLKKELV